MKTARLAVLGVALVAGLGAAYIMTMGEKPPEPVRIVAPAPAPIPSDAILLASRDLTVGAVVSNADMHWQSVPRTLLPQGAIVQSAQPNAMAEFKGFYVRTTISNGDPIRAERLSKDPGFMSAVLQSGMRAVAIDLSDQGRSYAGGFIRPGDHVDVIRTFHPDDAPATFVSERLLINVKILAIGPSEQDKPAEHTVFGSTATLEVSPAQAETIILAQRVGQLSLVLRSVIDAAKDDQLAKRPEAMTIIRSGNASQGRVLQ